MLRFIVTVTAVLTTSSAIYFYIAHQRLSKGISHTTQLGTLPKPTEIESIPACVSTPQYFTVYDKCSKSVPRASLPNVSSEILFTRLLRRNMTVFSRFPQALMLAMVSETPEQKGSFKSSHIEALDFREGDLVCGAYQVKLRRKHKVEFEIKTQGMDFAEGRLVISLGEIDQDGENLMVFSSETAMWRRAEEKRRMPLERIGLRWMHETAAWWLLGSGVKYLMDLE